MAEKKKTKISKGSKAKPNPTPKSVDLDIGGNVDKGNVVVGDHNYVVNNYYPVIEKNIEKHEPDFWALKHPYPMPPNFTGRIAERAMLTHWLKEDSENHLFILRALGGFGKSALAWQWLTHDIDIKEYSKVLWWSFYEGDASFEHFIEETLKYLKLEVPQGQRSQVDALLKAMQSQKILLIMDGFERALRAYSSMNAAYQGDEPKVEENQLDCVNINAEIFLKSICSLPNIKSKVLMTTRLTPRAVKSRGEFMLGCREVELTSMQPADAVEFFRKQKIKGTHTEIEIACAPYGYHPLSLCLLAGRILKDFANPADIVVAQKLKIDGDLIQQKHHVLEVSYNSLPQHEQKLLSTIACFRSPTELDTLIAISKPAKEEKPKGLSSLFKKKILTEYKSNINSDLQDLVERGLLHFDEKNKKFDIHPIVRRFAYERLTIHERTDAHVILVVYFGAVPQPQKIEKLEDLTPVIELYHHTVQAGEFDKAYELFSDRLGDTLYFQIGAYQFVNDLLSALLIDGENNPPKLKEPFAKGWTLNMLANSYSLTGQPQKAVQAYKQAIQLAESIADKKNTAIALENMAGEQQKIGLLHASEANLLRSIELCQDAQSEFWEAAGHTWFGNLLLDISKWERSKEEFEVALSSFKKLHETQYPSVTNAHYSRGFLLKTRDLSQSRIDNLRYAIEYAQRALVLAEENALRNFPFERDFIRAHWLLGASFHFDSQLELAEQHLSEALTRCRAINNIEHEANILLDLARLRYDQKNYEEAKSLADEALLITERCGYVLQGADVNLFLAQYTLEQEKDKAKAKQYAEEAKKLATCDGPPYYYKVAYEEAERILENLK